MQSSCNIKELRELTEQRFSISVNARDFEEGLLYFPELMDTRKDIRNRMNKRKMDLFKTLIGPKEEDNNIEFLFNLKPKKIVRQGGKLELLCQVFHYDPMTKKYVSSNEEKKIQFDFLIKSVGYENFREQSPSIIKCGWADTNGKGKLDDSY